MLDLTAIKARRDHGYDMPDISRTLALVDIDALLLEVERLTKENKQLITHALEYAYDETEGDCLGCGVEDGIHGKDCPVDFIERVSGKEV